MQAVLKAIELEKTYRSGKVQIPALRGVSLQVFKGEFVAVCGPSGCGKSTLLHILGGLTSPTSGSVLVDGEEMKGEARCTRIRRQKIGFVFQRFNLIPSLSASANVEMALRVRRIAQRDGAIEALRSVGLENRAWSRPGELSIGEQQRVAIARAVAHQPAILLADEPTGNLDSANARIVLDIFKKLNEQHALTVVMITHNEEAARQTRRIIKMRDGRIVGENT